MQNAMWLAGVFGPFMLIIGLWMLLFADNLMKVCTAIKNNAAAFYFCSVSNLLVGLVILGEYNVWSMDAYVLVTLLGWFMVGRGVLGLFLPQLLMKTSMSHTGFMKIKGIIPLVWGFVLCWLAFFM
jgi:hypothetical protein